MDSLFHLIIFAFWIMGYAFLWRITLLNKGDGSLPDPCDVTLIIPARNEEKTLGRLLNSVKGQSAPPGEVIVVDDHSEDSTAQIASQHGVKVLRSLELPQGWAGKPWGCWQGALAAKGKILVFLDADTFLSSEGLTKILSAFTEYGGLVTVQPYHQMERLYERLSAFFNIITMASMNAFTPLGSRLNPVGAFGPCVVCSKEDYFAVGGHAQVKGAVLENLELGKKFLQLRKPVRCFGGKGGLHFQMYPGGISSMIQGFSKGFASGAHAISLITLIIVVCWVFGSVSVTRHLLQEMFNEGSGSLPFWGVLYGLYASQIGWMLHRIGNFGFYSALLYPVPLLFFVAVFFLSLTQVFFLKRVRWKGRVIRTGKDVKADR